MERATFVSTISRVVEKTAAVTLMVMEDVLEYLADRKFFWDVDQVVWFSDSGPHYACLLTVSAWATRFTEMLRKKNNSTSLVLPGAQKNHGAISLSKYLGVEYHGKDSEDRYFSRSDTAVQDVAADKVVNSPALVVGALQDQARANEVCWTFPHNEVITDWIPSMSKQDICCLHVVYNL